MAKPKVEYERLARVSHQVNEEYDIVFDKCIPKWDGVLQDHEQLLIRYVKNGNTINNAPAFNEVDMMKAMVKLYHSSVISDEAKQILKSGLNKKMEETYE